MNMTRGLYLIAILLLMSSCVPDNIRNRAERQEVIADILGAQTENGSINWQYELQVDTIKEVRYDSIAVRLAINLVAKYDSYRKLESEMEKLFPEGHTNTTVGRLTEQQLDIYKKLVNMLPQIVKMRVELRQRIENFKPSYAPVVKVKTVKANSPVSFHYFFFNEKNEMVSHLQTGCFSGEEDVFKEFLGENNRTNFYASTFSKSIDNIDSISDFDCFLNKSTPVYIFRYVYHPEEIHNSYSSTYKEEPSVFPSGANLYEVKKQTYVTSSRDGYDRLIEYANANDLSSIDMMVVNGEIGILNVGDKVMMLDIGFAVSKVKNKHGNVVFVDTGSISKLD